MVRTPDPSRPRDAERSDAQLDMLHSFAAKLNVLTDTAEIGNTITAELRTIVDYHNCRVYLLQDGSRLMPIAFRGELTTEYAEEDLDTLITQLLHRRAGLAERIGLAALEAEAEADAETAAELAGAEGAEDLDEDEDAAVQRAAVEAEAEADAETAADLAGAHGAENLDEDADDAEAKPEA